MKKGAITLESTKGENIDDFCVRLVNLVSNFFSNRKNKNFTLNIVGVFEDVRLVANKNSTADSLREQYDLLLIKKGKHIVLEPHVGQNVDTFAEQLVSRWEHLAIKANSQFVVMGSFNGITLLTTGKQTPKMISDYYSDECRKESEAYHKTDKYKEEEKKRQDEVTDLQGKYDKLMQQLPSLDFKNYNTVLDFTSKYHTATDHIGVQKNHSIFIKALEDNGYVANANTGKNFKEDEEENVARYLIGQFLDCTKKSGCCPQVFDSFYEKYVNKFRKVTA